MHFAKSLFLGAAIALSVTAASAEPDQVASASGCLKLQDQVHDALAGNQQSTNFADAKKQNAYGREFCSNGFYAKGMEHYEHALQLLGVAEQGGGQKG
jgi:hypothetical protein